MIRDPFSGKIDKGIHYFPVRVYFEDTDAGGIVYHSVYLQYAERARTEMMRLSGLNHHEIMDKEGCMFVMRRCSLSYEKPARVDDSLVIQTHLTTATGARLYFAQKIFRAEILLVSIDVELAFCKVQGRVTRLPKIVLNVLEKSRLSSYGGDD